MVSSAKVPTGLLRAGQEAVDRLLEGGVRLRPFDHPDRRHLRVVRLGDGQEERGRALNPGLLALGQVAPDPARLFSAVETLLELREIEVDGSRVGREIVRAERLLVGEEPVVHRPVLALLAGAVGCLVRLECLGMDGLDGEIAEDVLHLAGGNVVALDLGECLANVAGAERTLVIRELHQGEPRVLHALERLVLDAEEHGGPLGRRLRPAPEQQLDFLKLLLDLRLAPAQIFEVFPQTLQLFVGLRKARRSAGEREQSEDAEAGQECFHSRYCTPRPGGACRQGPSMSLRSSARVRSYSARPRVIRAISASYLASAPRSRPSK